MTCYPQPIQSPQRGLPGFAGAGTHGQQWAKERKLRRPSGEVAAANNNALRMFHPAGRPIRLP